MFELGKFSLIILTRCNLRCKLCCEYVPQNKPFCDMAVEDADKILKAFFDVVDHLTTLHLTGGGEPFLHKDLSALIETAMKYSEKFDRLMLFTNCTIIPNDELKNAIEKYKDKIVVQISRYGINPDREVEVLSKFQETGATLKIEKYYGEEQSFGGWIDFGSWDSYGRSMDELNEVFHECSVTRVLKGNWRTRDGKVHWCTRSQRGMELGFLPDNPDDYVDLFDSTSKEEKQAKFERIANCTHLLACDHCSGDAGTLDKQKRYPAAEQEK